MAKQQQQQPEAINLHTLAQHAGTVGNMTETEVPPRARPSIKVKDVPYVKAADRKVIARALGSSGMAIYPAVVSAVWDADLFAGTFTDAGTPREKVKAMKDSQRFKDVFGDKGDFAEVLDNSTFGQSLSSVLTAIAYGISPVSANPGPKGEPRFVGLDALRALTKSAKGDKEPETPEAAVIRALKIFGNHTENEINGQAVAAAVAEDVRVAAVRLILSTFGTPKMQQSVVTAIHDALAARETERRTVTDGGDQMKPRSRSTEGAE